MWGIFKAPRIHNGACVGPHPLARPLFPSPPFTGTMLHTAILKLGQNTEFGWRRARQAHHRQARLSVGCPGSPSLSNNHCLKENTITANLMKPTVNQTCTSHDHSSIFEEIARRLLPSKSRNLSIQKIILICAISAARDVALIELGKFCRTE